MTREAALAHLDTYLDQVRRRLHALPPEEIQEVLDELRSHVLDRVEGNLTPRSVEAALDALGSPAEVARVNVTERAVAAVATGSAPIRVLRALWRVATVSVLGFFTFFVSLVGYGFAIAFLGLAVAKPFIPHMIGLWRHEEADGQFQYNLGAVIPAAGWTELIGWWVIPLCAAAGVIIGYLTWRLSAGALRLMGRGRRRVRRAG